MSIRVSFLLFIFSFNLFLSGCASLPREPVPIKHINNAEVIGTANMDAQRPVVWNMGLIAKSNHPLGATVIS